MHRLPILRTVTPSGPSDRVAGPPWERGPRELGGSHAHLRHHGRARGLLGHPGRTTRDDRRGRLRHDRRRCRDDDTDPASRRDLPGERVVRPLLRHLPARRPTRSAIHRSRRVRTRRPSTTCCRPPSTATATSAPPTPTRASRSGSTARSSSPAARTTTTGRSSGPPTGGRWTGSSSRPTTPVQRPAAHGAVAAGRWATSTATPSPRCGTTPSTSRMNDNSFGTDVRALDAGRAQPGRRPDVRRASPDNDNGRDRTGRSCTAIPIPLSTTAPTPAQPTCR